MFPKIILFSHEMADKILKMRKQRKSIAVLA